MIGRDSKIDVYKSKKIVRSLVGFLLLFILWEVIAKSGRVSWAALPPIEDCFMAFIQASVGGRIFMDIASSLYRVFIGLAIGFSIGGTMGIITGWFTPIQDL
ncbi:MAG: hypothetical protein ACPLYF_00945, partial [Fervidobacterium sp.]